MHLKKFLVGVLLVGILVNLGLVFCSANPTSTNKNSDVVIEGNLSQFFKSVVYNNTFDIVVGRNASTKEIKISSEIAKSLKSYLNTHYLISSSDNITEISLLEGSLNDTTNNLILVGTPESNLLIKELNNKGVINITNNSPPTIIYLRNATNGYDVLVISGNDSYSVEKAGKELIRYLSNTSLLENIYRVQMWKRKVGYKILSLDMTSDGKYIVVGSKYSGVYLFHKNGDLLWEYSTNGDVVSVDISPDGKYIVASEGIDPEDDKLISKAYNIYYFSINGSLIWNYSLKCDKGSFVRISSDGDYVVACPIGSSDVIFFNRKGEILKKYGVNLSSDDSGLWSINSLSITPDGEYGVANVRFDETYSESEYSWTVKVSHYICFFSRLKGLMWYYKPESPNYGLSISINPDGEYVVVGDDGHIYFLNRKGDILWKYKVGDVVLSVDTTSNGNVVAGVGYKIYFLDNYGKLIWNKSIPYAGILSIDTTPNGDYIVAGCHGNVYFLNRKGDILWKYKVGDSVDDTIDYVSVSNDGRYVVAKSRKYIYFFNNQNFMKLEEFKNNISSKFEEVENNISFAKSNNINTSESEKLLNWAKDEFNKGNYKKAYDLASQSQNKIEEQINNLINLANSKITELQNLIDKLNSQNIDTEELKTSLNNAKTKLNNKEYHLSLTIANQSIILANQILSAKQTIDNAKNLISQEKSKGHDVAEAEDLLNKAEIEFQNKNYKKAENLAKQSLTKLSYIKEVADLAKLKIDEANQSISKAKFLKFLGLSTKESELLLSQAIKQYNLGNYEDAKKLAEQSKSKADELLFTSLKFGGGILLVILFIGIVITKGKSLFTKTPEVPEFPKQLYKKYIPLQKIGEGGFAKVFKVKRKSDKNIIALKIPNLTKENIEKFFKKEVEAWKKLNHKNIVKMFNAYEKPIPHIEMEYIDGYNLNGKLIRNLDEYPKPLNVLEAINLIKQIAEGLKHAHNKNIIHRDLKPSNILLASDKAPKITDWGLAKIGDKSSTTTRGFTLAYASPEVLRDEKTDNRTDIYQLGVIFYELLTGKLPYDALTEEAVIKKILDENIKPTPISKINPNLAKYDKLFDKLLAKNKEDRFNSIDEFIKILEEIKKSSEIREEIKKSLTLTTKLSKEDKELIYLAVNKLIDYALINAKLDDKAELLNALNEIKYTYYNKDDLINLISQIEYMLKNDISINEGTINQLNSILNKIKSEIFQKLKEERDKLKTSLKYTKAKLSKTKNKSEKKKLTYSAVNTLTKYALISAELNNIDDVLMALEELLLFIKNKENKKELKGAIGHLKHLRDTNLKISEKVKNMLYIVLENVKREFI